SGVRGGAAGPIPVGCEGGSIDQRANGQLCRIIQPCIGWTRRVQSVRQVTGRANKTSPAFHTSAGIAPPSHAPRARDLPLLGSRSSKCPKLNGSAVGPQLPGLDSNQQPSG